MSEVFGLFPTPVMRVEKLLDEALRASIVSQADTARNVNSKSDLLTHTGMIIPSSKGPFFRIAKLVAPKLAEFGALLFGETLNWSVKEMWINVLETGGAQAMHTHANSFISGVIYITHSHPSANTVFIKGIGGTDFVFTNQSPKTKVGQFNGGKWITPQANAGDMMLFPSYLLHEVPQNRGERRISLSFNAIPERLDSWGYSIRLSK